MTECRIALNVRDVNEWILSIKITIVVKKMILCGYLADLG